MSAINQFLTNEFTEVIQKLIQQVQNDPTTYIGAKYFPSVALPVRKIRTEVIEATGGLTNQHLPGTNPKYIQSFGTHVQEYQAPHYKEAIHYDEERLLYLRELGQNGRNIRGAQDYITRDIDRLNRRVEARIEFERWNAVFNGGFDYLGKSFSFGIPAGLRAVPIGGLWSLDSVNFNPAANPLVDIRYWCEGGLSPFRKYVIRRMIMNPNTARWIVDNPNSRSFITSFGANAAMTDWELNKILSFVIPGGPEAVVYKGWYQSESVDVNGHLTVSDAIYMIPDGMIWFETDLPNNDRVGEFVQGINLASGTIDNPGVGKFLVIEDNTVPGSKGGLANPFVDLFGGVYGGIKLDRAFDVLTAKVI